MDLTTFSSSLGKGLSARGVPSFLYIEERESVEKFHRHAFIGKFSILGQVQ